MDLEVISNSIMDLSNSNLYAQILSSNLSQSYFVYVGLEKNRAWFNLQQIRLCHVVITLTCPSGKVDPHGSLGIVAQVLRTWHGLILTTLLVLICTLLVVSSRQSFYSFDTFIFTIFFFFFFFNFGWKKHKNSQPVISITLAFYSFAIYLHQKLRKRLKALLPCKFPKQFPFIRSKVIG